ncbi:hypothetical protein BVI1335_820005 [Burkholderia vietnamiensis]|nr:hypothetical protein BVI1335_820005 [Burkholderia vietnamiensis]
MRELCEQRIVLERRKSADARLFEDRQRGAGQHFVGAQRRIDLLRGQHPGPTGSSQSSFLKKTNMKRRFTEEQITGFLGGRGLHAGQRAVQGAWGQGRIVLHLACEILTAPAWFYGRIGDLDASGTVWLQSRPDTEW